MRHYLIGNVLKTAYGTIIIITNHRTLRGMEYYDWVSFSHSNSSGGSYFDTQHSEDHHLDDNGDICGDPECEVCHGTGLYTKTTFGLDEAVYLGSCVQEYILNCLTKNFDF